MVILDFVAYCFILLTGISYENPESLRTAHQNSGQWSNAASL